MEKDKKMACLEELNAMAEQRENNNENDDSENSDSLNDGLSEKLSENVPTIQLLGNAFNRASSDLKVVEEGIQISKPMRKNGTTNIAVMFEMTDGQTVSVMFHNPDTTPQKITPDDMLISWKWLLNRKDITIVVAKENGKDLPLQTVARRIMALVSKNTARFAKANANKAAETELLAQLEAEKAAKLTRLEELNALAEQRVNNNENNAPENSDSLNDENNQEIDLNTLPKTLDGFKQDNATDFEAARDYFRAYLQGKFVNTVIGKVHLLGSTLGKMKAGMSKDDIKAALIPFVPEILQAEYEGSKPLKKSPSNQNYVAFHAFTKGGLIVRNKEIQARILVGERDDGQYEFVAYSLHHNNGVMDSTDPISTLRKTAEAPMGSVLGIAAMPNNLHKNQNGVNVIFDNIQDGKDGWNIEIVSIRELENEKSGSQENDENSNEIKDEPIDEPVRLTNDEIKQQYKQRWENKDFKWLSEHYVALVDIFTKRIAEVKEKLRKYGFREDGPRRMEIGNFRDPDHVLLNIDVNDISSSFGYWCIYNFDGNAKVSVPDLLDRSTDEIANEIISIYQSQNHKEPRNEFSDEEYQYANELLEGYLDTLPKNKVANVINAFFERDLYTKNRLISNDRLKVAFNFGEKSTVRPYISSEETLLNRRGEPMLYGHDGFSPVRINGGKKYGLSKIGAEFAMWLWDKKHSAGLEQNQEQTTNSGSLNDGMTQHLSTHLPTAANAEMFEKAENFLNMYWRDDYANLANEKKTILREWLAENRLPDFINSKTTNSYQELADYLGEGFINQISSSRDFRDNAGHISLSKIRKRFLYFSMPRDSMALNVKLKGDELGVFDTSSQEGKAQLRQAARTYLESLRGKWVHNKHLNADIEIRQRGIDELIHYSGNSLKLLLVADIENIIATAVGVGGGFEVNGKKGEKENVRNYFRLWNMASIQGVAFPFQVIIEQDELGLLHYDLILDSTQKAVMDNLSTPSDQSWDSSNNQNDFKSNDTNQNDESQDRVNLIIVDGLGQSVSSDEKLQTLIENAIKYKQNQVKNKAEQERWRREAEQRKQIEQAKRDKHDEIIYKFSEQSQLNPRETGLAIKVLNQKINFANTVATRAEHLQSIINAGGEVKYGIDEKGKNTVTAWGVDGTGYPVETATERKFAFWLQSNSGSLNDENQEKMANLVNIATSNKGGNKYYVDMGQLSERTAQAIFDLTGQNVSGWKVSVDESAIRHVLKQHGNENTEEKRGQIAITQADFSKILDIVNGYDQIALGDEPNTIKFIKQIDNQYIVIGEMRLGREKLALKTMYKRKQPISAPVAPDENQSTAETSKTFGNQIAENNDTTNPAKQQAIDFLNDIINGRIDGMADGVLDRLLELVEPFEDDDEINELADKASAIIEESMPKDIE